MKIIFTDLFDAQIESILTYILNEFGAEVTEKVRDKIFYSIANIPPFVSKYPLYLSYNGFDIHRMTNKRNYVFYAIKDNTLFAIAIFDTRMSPKMMRETIKRQISTI